MTEVMKKIQYKIILPYILIKNCFVISSLCNESKKHINTDYAVTDWMLCVIPRIREDVFKNAKNKHHIQVNNVIKTLFFWIN